MKKKLFIVGLFVAAALSVTGCSASKDKSPKKVASSGEIETNDSGGLMAGVTPSTVELCEYKGVKVGRSAEEVGQDAIDKAINSILSEFATSEKSEEGTVADGNTANIDYVGTIDGQEFDGGKDTGFDLVIGSNSFIEGFEEGLIGVKVGDTVTLNLKFPDTYNKTATINNEEVNLAGKDVTFEVKVNYLTITTNPELTDEFVAENGKKYGDSKTVDELKSYIKEQIILSNKLRTAWPQVIEDSKVTIDKKEKEQKYSELYEHYKNMISANYGKDIETYVKDYGTTMEEFTQTLKDEADYQVKCRAISNAIARAEDITITEDEYQEKAAEDIQYYGYADINEYQKDNPKQDVVDNIIYYEVLEFIGENALVVDDSELETGTQAQSE